MKKWTSTLALVVIAILAVAAPAAAYSQRTTYPDGSSVTWKDGICPGYGSSETDFTQTIRLGDNVNACDYIQVRANYKNGSWTGYSSWKRGTGYVQFAPSGAGVIQFGQHGIDSWH